jgi:hypothetical protein
MIVSSPSDLSFAWSGSSFPVGTRPDWQRKNPQVLAYKASRTVSFFHLDNRRVRGIMGPLGSGKSTGCSAEIMARAVRQPIDSTGKRRVRCAVIRNTYRELADSTIRTWLDWFPEEHFGRFNRGENTHELRVRLPDNSILELDVIFRALDKPADVKKLLSVEYTFAWVNEAREVPKVIIDMLFDRIGRFPSYRDPAFQPAIARVRALGLSDEQLAEINMADFGGYWSGIMMDTNPPDEDHWWFRIFETERPASWRLYRQPSGRSPQAENLEFLRPGYYSDSGGRSPEWIKVYYDGEYGFVSDGRPVYSEYTDSFHCTDWARPIPGAVVRVGLDFGLTPAAAFVQQDAHGRWRVIDELVSENMGVVRFAELLNTKIQAEYRGFDFTFHGDPAGDQRVQTDEETPFRILRANGINAHPARTNDFNLRREAVASPLMRIVDGKPGLAIHPKCKQLRKGMAGKYCYRRVQIVGDERYHDKPDKGMYSHVCEALQYVMIESGSNPTLSKVQQANPPQTFIASPGWSPFESRVMVPAFSGIVRPDPSLFRLAA